MRRGPSGGTPQGHTPYPLLAPRCRCSRTFKGSVTPSALRTAPPYLVEAFCSAPLPHHVGRLVGASLEPRWTLVGPSLDPRSTLARPSLEPRWERRGSVGAALRGVLEWPPAYGARGEPHATAAPRRRSANPMSHQANRRAKFDIVCHFREDHPVTPSLSDQGSRSSARRTLRGLGAIAALVDAPTLRLCPARTRRLPRPAVGVSVLVTSSPRRRGLGRGRVSQSPPWRRPPRGGGWELSRLGRALPAAVHT